MRGIWQAAAGLVLGAVVSAEETAAKFVWDAPKVRVSVFSREIGLLDAERDDYATNLANLAVHRVTEAKASSASLADARRMMALALHLSPRNRRAVVVNYQFGQGMLPAMVDGDYSPQVFSRLMLTRGQLLREQEGFENLMLARFLIQLAAELDPRNEDAVFHSEILRLDHGALDWSALTDPQPASFPAVNGGGDAETGAETGDEPAPGGLP